MRVAHPRPAAQPVSDEEAVSDGMPLRPREFAWFRDLIYREAGIHLREGKQHLLASRLGRRLRALKLHGFAEYVTYLAASDPDGEERRQLINCITTNKTDFFRESHHFSFLSQKLFPTLRERAKRGGPRRLRIWSSACSTGEEPYSLAMTVLDHFGSRVGWQVEILASDIDTDVLARAEAGVYPDERLDTLTETQRRQHFQRGTGSRKGFWRVRPELKNLITFRQVNLNHAPWPVQGPFDAIFCRNVIIYFDKPTQVRLFERMARELDPGGLLIIGHSESLLGVSERYDLIGRTIHRLRPSATTPAEAGEPSPVTTLTPSGRPRGVKERRIIVGEVYASKDPVWIRTLLGSCVSACLYDPQAGVGGMNHFLLAAGNESGDRAARYGVQAMELLINDIMKLGGERHRLIAKVFGAGHVLSQIPNRVADQNAEFVCHFLEKEGIPIAAQRLGGSSAREVWFETATGRVRLRQIAPSAAALAAEEAQARAKLEADLARPEPSTVTLF